MKVCVFGAGAVGGHAAARLIAAGKAEISVVARGAHLAAIRDRGLFLETEGQTLGGKPAAATDDPKALPPQDLVVITLKAPALPAAAGQIAGLLGDGAAALFFTNGIPWWWHHGLDEAGALALLDPEGRLWRELGPERVLGGVVYSSNSIETPGIVTHYNSNRWIIGEPGGGSSPRAETAADLFQTSGLNAELSADIRRDMWEKLVLNIVANPLSALTRLPLDRWSGELGLSALGTVLIRETLAVAKATGWDLTDTIDPDTVFPSRPRRAGGRPSMLQDVESGRPMEVEAIVGQIQAFGRDHGVPTPAIDVLLPLLRGLDAAVSGPSSG